MDDHLSSLEWSVNTHFDLNTVRLGHDYRSKGLVKNYPAVDTIHRRISGDVASIDGESHFVTVNYDSGQVFAISLATCSCAIGRDCFHAAALLLEVAHLRSVKTSQPPPVKTVSRRKPLPPKRSPKRVLRIPVVRSSISHVSTATQLNNTDTSQVRPEVRAWLNQIDVTAAEISIAEMKLPMSYILHNYSEGSSLELWIGYQIQLADDQKRLYVSGVESLKDGPEGYLDDANRLLLKLPECFIDGAFIFPNDSELSGLLLRRLISTKKCFWKTVGGKPLSFGDARVGELSWTTRPDGNHSLKLIVDSPNTICVFAGSYFYIDRGQGLIGAVQSNLPSKQLSAILSGPPLTLADASVVSELLKSKGVKLELPCPVSPQTEPNEKTPVVCLRLKRLTLAHPFSGPESCCVAVLSFDYGDWNFGSKTANHLKALNDSVPYARKRSDTFERLSIERLKNSGLHIAEPLNKQALPPGSIVARFQVQQEKQWRNFLANFVPVLRTEGWRIDIEQSFSFRETVYVDSPIRGRLDEKGREWFSLKLDINVDGQSLPLLPILSSALSNLAECNETTLQTLNVEGRFIVPLPDGRSLSLPYERVKAIILALVDLFDGQVSEEAIPISKLQAIDLISNLPTDAAYLIASEKLCKLAGGASDLHNLQSVQCPSSLKANLRDYQLDGLKWLQFLSANELGGILADDMGLGKTLQTLAHILLEKESGKVSKPCLIICPTSVVPNWISEVQKFAPHLNVVNLSGSDRSSRFQLIPEADLVISSYALLLRDSHTLVETDWEIVVLDEAQAIKNSGTSVANEARRLQARQKLCLTGTPIENHLGELWALFNFIMPGALGEQKAFTQQFRTPIEKNADKQRQQLLSRIVKPFILRRTKSEVAKELPPKTIIVKPIELTGQQRDLYETVRLTMHEKVQQEISEKGLNNSQLVIFDALLKLRQVCCHPGLLSIPAAALVTESAKLRQLNEMLSQLVEEGRKILVFSQFTSMLDVIEGELDRLEIPFVTIRGDTKDRRTPVEEFQNGEVPVFLLSLRAGGTGLNLTAADTVIHYDPWWNPAVEDQATDRAYRIGQDKAVFVFKLIAAGTVEERMVELQERKRRIAAGLFDSEIGSLPIDERQLAMLFNPIEGSVTKDPLPF